LKKSGILNFRFHDLRHTFASQLVMSGVDINTVRELLGHKDIRMTIRYSHLSQDYKRHAVGILERQMDTIWTPEQQSKKLEKIDVSQLLENIAVV
jgi:integrase